MNCRPFALTLIRAERLKTHAKGFIGLQVYGIGAGKGP